MNRKDRRKMSHNLGIMQYQQKLPLNKKFELIRENIIAGKQQHAEFVAEVERQQHLTQEEKDSENIQLLAQHIAKQKSIAVIDALEEAQKTYYKGQKK
jgi:hypothetical protein